MKILLINSSNRKNGNTDRALDLFESMLLDKTLLHGFQVEVERISLGRQNILTCRGCRACFDAHQEACPLKDDLTAIHQRMQDADGFVFGSPVYVEDVNGIMKNWIDRMAFNSHRPSLYGKCAAICVTSGIGSSSHPVRTIGSALNAWGIQTVGSLKLRLGALTSPEEIDKRYRSTIAAAADKLLLELKGDKKSTSLYSLIAFQVQKNYWLKNPQFQNTFDYQYWSKQGWLAKERHYYTPLGVSQPKQWIAISLGKLVVKYFKFI